MLNSRIIIILAAVWTIAVSWCQLSGWGLSLIGSLHRTGYLVCLVPGLLIASLFVKKSIDWSLANHMPATKRAALKRSHRSFRMLKGFRLFQALFIFICLVSLCGALINAPFGWDAFGYRIPRVLRWLQDGQWSWLQSGDSRLDVSSVVNEWQLAAVFALFAGDRLIFLINFLPYLLFPGLLYVASRHIGLSRYWSLFIMWFIPLGYCFSLASAGVQNDGVAGIHAVAAVAFLSAKMRFVISRGWGASFSLINIALLSGMKLSNAPLAGMLFLFWLWNIRKEVFSLTKSYAGPVYTVGVCLVCSIIPVAVLNKMHEGAWSGDSDNRYSCESTNYVAAPIVNGGFLVADAFTPNPFAKSLNSYLAPELKKSDWVAWLVSKYPMAVTIRFSLLPYEGAAGPGFPLLIVLPLCLLAACFQKRRLARISSAHIFLALTGIAYAVYLMKVASNASPRIAAPYFPLLWMGLIGWISARGWQPRKVFNQLCYLMTCAVVIGSLIVMTSRPILPRLVISALDSKANHSYELHRYSSKEVGRFASNYSAPIYYVTQWGAMTHRLHVPYRDSGKAIEVGSTEWNRNRPQGKGLFAFTEDGIKKRYGMSVEKFLANLGSPQQIDKDKNVPEIAKENAFFLYEVSELSKIPEPLFSRTYHSDGKHYQE